MSQEESEVNESKRLERWYLETIEKLKINFNALKAEYLDYRKYHQSQKQKWYEEITKKRNELEDMGLQFDKETEQFKTLQQELFEEKKMKERLKLDLETSDKYRVMVSDLQEEVDRLKFDLEQKNDDFSRTQDQMRREYEERLEELEDEQRIHLTTGVNQTKLQEDLKTITFQLHAAQARQEEQGKEVEELRNEKLEQIRVHELTVQSIQSKFQKSQKSQRHLQLQVSRLKVQSEAGQIQVKDLTDENEKLQKSNLSLQKKVSEVQRVLETEQHQFMMTRKQFQIDNSKLLRQKDMDIEQMSGKIRILQKDNDSLQHQVEELETQTKKMEAKYEEKYTQLMQQEFGQITKLKQGRADIQLRLGEAERLSSQQNKVWASEKERLRKNLEDLKSQLSDREEETNRISDRMEQMQEIILRMKQERMNVEEELDSLRNKEGDWRNERIKITENNSKLKQRLEKAKVSMEYKEREQLDLLSKLESWRKEKNSQARQGGQEFISLQEKVKQLRSQRNKLKKTLDETTKRWKKKYRNIYRLYSDKNRQSEHFTDEFRRKEENLFNQIRSLRTTISRLKRENERINTYNQQFPQQNNNSSFFNNNFGTGTGGVGIGGAGSFLDGNVVNNSNNNNNISGQSNLNFNNNSKLGMNYLMKDIKHLNEEVHNFLLL